MDATHLVMAFASGVSIVLESSRVPRRLVGAAIWSMLGPQAGRVAVRSRA